MTSSKFIPNSFQHPNAYVDEYMHLLSGNEYKVLTYAIRRIIGFQKTDDRISVSQFSSGITAKDGTQLDNGTGIGEGAVRNALQELVKYRLMIIISPADPKTNNPPLFTLQWNSDHVDKQGLELRKQEKKAVDSDKADKARAGLPPRSNGQTGSNGQTSPGLTDNTSPGLTNRGDNIPEEIQGNPPAPDGASLVEPPPSRKKGDLLDGMIHYARQANGKADLSFLAEHLRPLASAFLEIAGNTYQPHKTDYSFWRKTLNEWYERGFSPEQVKTGTRAHLEKRLSLKGPASVTYAILEGEHTPSQPERVDFTALRLQGQTL